MKKIYKKYWGEFLLVLASLSYSFEWYFIRDLSENGFSALEITLWRLFFASLIILLFFLFFDRKSLKLKTVRKNDFKLLFLFTLLAISANIAFNTAIINTSVSNVLILIYLWVFWWFLFGVLFFKEKASIKKFIYTFLAFVWIILVVTKDIYSFSFQFWIWELLAIFVSFIMAISVVINKHLIHIKAFLRVLISFSIGWALMIWYLFFTEGIWYFYKFFQSNFIFSAWLLALTSWVLWRWLKDLWTNYVPVSIVLIIMLLEPIMQIFTAYLFADEVLSLLNIFWITLLLVMIVLISRKKGDITIDKIDRQR